MQPAPKRDELDRIAETYALDAPGVDKLLDIAGARPSRAATVAFLARCASYGGVLSLAAGVVFFVAANWSRIAVFGRFAMLEVLLVALVAVAIYKPPPRFVGRAATFLAFIVTGALLALFGQTYQTGADVYELFLMWAILGLPFAIAAQWGMASAAWILVLNASLALFCGWQPRGGLLWLAFDGRHFTTTHALLAAACLDLALWFLFDRLRPSAVPDWTRRLILSCAFVFVTWVGVLGVTAGDMLYHDEPMETLAILGAFASMGLVAGYALKQRTDVYPLAVAMGSFIIVVLCWIPRVTNKEEATFFLLALWLIGSSTVAGTVLMRLIRRWRVEAA